MAMKLFVRLMGLVLVLALAGPFILQGPDGKPLMEMADVTSGIAKQWRAMTTNLQRSAGNDDAGKVEVHRWRDANGQWHYSDGDGAAPDAEVLLVDPNVNVMDAPPRRAAPADEGDTQAAPRAAPADSARSAIDDIPLPLTISPGQVKQVVDDARSVESVLEKREQQLATRSTGQ